MNMESKTPAHTDPPCGFMAADVAGAQIYITSFNCKSSGFAARDIKMGYALMYSWGQDGIV